MSALREAVMTELMKELKLPTIGRLYGELARQAAGEGWTYEDYLRELLSAEIQTRRERSAAERVRQARFPEPKSLSQLEWDAIEGVSKQKLLELSSCDYIDRGENIVLAGPVGTGKTHIAISLGMEAALRRYRVLFVRASDLVRDLTEARDARQLGRMHQRLVGTPLLVLDELGFVPFDRAGGELLFNLLSERHGRRSTILTTNLSFSEWVQVFADEKLTTALLDRLAENSHVLTLTGESYRMKKRRLGN